MPIDQEKLARLQKLSANNKVGGIRRKQVNSSSKGQSKDDTKLQSQVSKLNSVNIRDVAEANFFKEDGTVLHFDTVGIQTAPQHNTTVFYGTAKEKQLQDLFPTIIPQMGQDSINALTQMANQIKDMQEKEKSTAGQDAKEGDKKEEDGIPTLVEGQTFDDVE
ncbi:probable Nascent polypeptide-associated complex subunit beta [Saccharomycodes ludwigii]|uniref:Nascent polypeptide-associated complex subunit beta n=1 Tax=Saccharomycodes ludwigii TaxID=36035 RepID=A0A376B1U0_9ASCO|nr:hypothetical protein SCDLUD_001951 [Saccharomycodes ludwigii]KAH3902138.1 hypothetical protein SCDLUD_001951 [Saccharomycodes ludwigii]SSD58602.1 probable Nascent polypeptide-associated complex subunit beta [Saccharomycodes ludwigii]